MRTPRSPARGPHHARPGPLPGLLDRPLQGPRGQGRYRTHPPGVYRLAGAAESPRQKLRAATLWGGEGTAASHTSAAALVGLKGFTLSDLHAVTTKDPR